MNEKHHLHFMEFAQMPSSSLCPLFFSHFCIFCLTQGNTPMGFSLAAMLRGRRNLQIYQKHHPRRPTSCGK